MRGFFVVFVSSRAMDPWGVLRACLEKRVSLLDGECTKSILTKVSLRNKARWLGCDELP